MSLITRCPACGTMFRVVPDQLRISDGWVRCGHCSEVFDASLHLQTQAPVPQTAEAVEPVAVAPAAAPLAAPPVQAAPPPALPASFSPFNSPDPVAAPSDVPSSPWGTMPTQAQQPPAAESAFASPSLNESFLPEDIITPPMHRPSLPDDAPEPAHETAASAQDQEEAKTAPAERLKSEMPEATEATEVQEPPEAEREPEAPAALQPVQTAEEPTESTIEDMSFVRDARRKAFWRRPMVRVALGVFSVLLLVLLVLQVAVHERDRLAVLEPNLKPWLDELCAPIKCSVQPLRQIESLVIESSSFNKVRGNVYRLNVSVRNKAPFPLAMPGIELALTDSQDQPVLRRVLLPAELGAAAVIAAGGEWSGSLPVSVAASSQTARISGYRLLAFYP